MTEATKLYRKIIKRNPREFHALHSLGIIETAAGNHAEAARLMARSLTVQPNNIPFMQNHASANPAATAPRVRGVFVCASIERRRITTPAAATSTT